MSFGLEAHPVPEHPNGMRGISRSVREVGEVAHQAAAEEGEEVPAQLCTILCHTGQLVPGSAVPSDKKQGRKSRMVGTIKRCRCMPS